MRSAKINDKYFDLIPKVNNKMDYEEYKKKHDELLQLKSKYTNFLSSKKVIEKESVQLRDQVKILKDKLSVNFKETEKLNENMELIKENIIKII